MKKLILVFLMAFACIAANAQDDMSEIYKKEVDHSFDYTANGHEDGYSYASSSKEISVFNNKTGDLLWSKKYSEISDQLRKVDDVISVWDANIIFVLDRKMGKDKIACIDALTGSLLWVSDKYQNVDDAENVIFISELDAFAIATKENLTLMKVRTGEQLWQTTKFKGVIGDYLMTTDGSLVMINMKATLIGSLFSGFKNQLTRINTKNGEIIWDQTYRGIVEKKILTRERLVKLTMEDDKVFLYMNGIQVFDYSNGKPLWAAVYDETPSKVVKQPSGVTKFGAYGVVARPVIVGEHIYVIDMLNKRNQYLKKIELKTGKVIWQSSEIKDARAIPGIYVAGDKVILQVGGQVELQYVKKSKNPDGSFTISNVIETENVKPLNVQCFNAATGVQLWESEKMKKGLTNLFLSGQNAIVCSGKALYSLDIATGKENYEVPLKEDNIGLADQIFEYNDQVVIIGEKGVSTRNKADGAYVASSKFKKSTPISHNGQILYGTSTLALYTENSDYAVYDLKDVKYKRFDARKGAAAYLADDGLSLYVFEGGGMLRKSKFTKLNVK